MSDRDKEIEALARLLCRSVRTEPDVLVTSATPIGPFVLNGQHVHIVGEQTFPAWRCYAETAAAVVEAGWVLETEADLDAIVRGEAAPTSEPVEDPAAPRTAEDKWRDNAGLR